MLCESSAMTTKLNKTTEQIRDEAIDLLCDCAGQFLIETNDGNLTHSFMSTEERLCAFLVENGRMQEVGHVKFRLLPDTASHPTGIAGEVKGES